MARGLNMVFLAAIAVAALIHSSAAQSNHTVGDTTGWAIPSTGSAFYSTWAANKTFSVGDILVFNFVAGAHDVAEVTKADYDACTSSSPISLTTTAPARITINALGEHYFLCNFPGHCSRGQKLMINVSDASSSPSPAPQTSSPTPQPSTPQPSTPAPQPSTPAPQPSTPPPQSSPAPQPSTPTPSSSPSPASTPPPTPASSPSPPSPTPASSPSPPSPTPASSPSPPSPPATTPPTAPPPNSATSLGLAGFTTFLSIFVALCY